MPALYRLSKSFTFEAAHQLPSHDGTCSRLHGHSWVGKIVCAGETLQTKGPKAGMLVDFYSMKEALDPIVEGYLDHYYLNDSTHLKNPTSEELARWVYDMVKPRLSQLISVEIQETCTSSCIYQP